MQRTNKLSTRLLAMVMTVAMVCTMMSTTVFAEEVGTPDGVSDVGASSIGTIKSFDKLEDRFIPSVGKDAPEYVYGLTVELNTPVEELNLPTTLGATVERSTPDTTVSSEAVAVTWQSDKEYKPDENGTFIYTAEISDEYILADGVNLPQIYVAVGTKQARAGGLAHDIGSGGPLSLATDDGCSVDNPHVVTGTSTTNFITAASGEHWVTLNGVTIDASATTGSGGDSGMAGESAFDLQGTSTVHLTLKDGTTNTLTGGTERAAIQVRAGTSLVIDGGGRLDAAATSVAAGIGASSSIAMGSITIKGGIINAIGSGNPGIGCVTELNEGGTIIIKSGTVTTTCATAYGGGINTGKGGTIAISGGNISATSKDPFAAIGSGGNGTITISDNAVVTAIAEVGAGIGGDGGDMFNSGGTINITGGTITATSGAGAGIGSGSGAVADLGAAGGTVNISGGTVTATSSSGAGIGGGMFGAGGTINITGGTVIASGNGTYGYGIGGMDASIQPSGDVKISDAAKVTAVSTTAGNAIADTNGIITPDSGTVANVMQFDFVFATPASTAIEVKNSSGTSLSPAVSYAPDAAFQSLALTAPTVGDYTAYQGESKLTFRPVGGSSSETFPVVTGLNKYTDVLGPDITIAKALTINTAKPVSGGSIKINASTAPTGATASRLTWVDAEGNTVAGNTVIQESTVYTSTHVFTAQTGYAFDSTIAETDITVTNIGAGSKTIALSGDHKILTVVVTWPETSVLPAYAGTQAPAPDATTASKTETSIKLKGVTVSDQTIEYAKSTTNVAPTADADWQTSTTFSNLTKGTTYYFFARVRMNELHKAGTASAGTPITTDGETALADYTGTQAAAPSSTPSARTDVSITLAAVTVSGETIEYVKSTTSTAPTTGWQDSPVFSGLTADTQYYFFARVKATTTHKAGITSTGTAIKTDMSNAQKLAAAKLLADAAITNLTATNATTGAGILSTVSTAITSVPGVTATWKAEPTITAATESAAGSIAGTMVLTCGSATVEVTVSKTIAQLGNDAEKVASAKDAAIAALGSYTATNATADSDIMALVNKAIADAGITDVTAAWKVGSGFDKTNATASATGSVTGTITLKLNSAEQDVVVNLTIAQLADKAALTAAIDTANNAKSGIAVSDNVASAVASGTRFVNTAEMTALNNAIASAQVVANNPASTAEQISIAITTLNSAVTTFNAAIKTGTYTAGGNTGSGSDDSSSSSSNNVINTPVGNTGTNNAVNDVVKAAVAAGKGTATSYINFTNYTTLTTEGLKAINDAAAKAVEGKKIVLNTNVQFDKTAGGVVTSRITVDPAKLAKAATGTIGLNLWFNQKNDTQVTSVNTLFTKHFDNKLVTITFEQKAPLAVNVELALKPDISGLNTKNLYFYSYNPTTNLYNRIWSPNYWVDKNGYSHITAPFGGSVIVTDKPLTAIK